MSDWQDDRMSAYWEQLVAAGLKVPADRDLTDLTAELTTLLGSTDPAERDDIAYAALHSWIAQGVYDDLLAGLGDGMSAGLDVGLGEPSSDTVFRRAYSARVLGDCVARDTERGLVPPGKVLEWGDRIATWYLREVDLRGYVFGKGWAHAAAYGADALAAVARSPHLGKPELTVVLDVLADRVLMPGHTLLVSGEPDRMAEATWQVLCRNLVPLSVLEPWVQRLAAAASIAAHPEDDPRHDAFNAQAFLRSLHLKLALGGNPPQVRSDLLLVMVEVLRATNPRLLGGR